MTKETNLKQKMGHYQCEFPGFGHWNFEFGFYLTQFYDLVVLVYWYFSAKCYGVLLRSEFDKAIYLFEAE